jgi:hypothetical protein
MRFGTHYWRRTAMDLDPMDYAETTALMAEAKMAQEEADSARAEERREEMAGIPHKFRRSEFLLPNFCGRCGCREDHQIHTTRKEPE